MKAYPKMTALAQGGLQDSESATWFMTGAPHFHTYVAKAGKEIIGAISIRKINKDSA